MILGTFPIMHSLAQAQWDTAQDEEYGRRFLEQFHEVSPLPSLESYANPARYDELYRNGQLDAELKTVNNDSGGIAWGWAYRMMSLNEMFRATGGLRYLEDNLNCARAVLAARDDIRGVTLWNGVIAPAWSSDKYAERGRCVFAVHTGMVVYPILDCLLLAKPHSAELNLATQDFQTIQQSALESLAYHDRQWRDGPGEGEGFYIGMDQENGLEGKPLPGNRLSAMGRALWASWKLTGNEEHHRRAKAIGLYIKNRLTPAPDGAFYWPYSLPAQAVADASPKESIKGEDISHGSLTLSLPIFLATGNEVFTKDDMARFGNTVRNGFARLNNGILFGVVTGDPKSNPNLAQIPGRWLPLTPFAPDVFDRLSLFFRKYQPTPSPLDLALLIRYSPQNSTSRAESGSSLRKKQSVLYPRELRERAIQNARQYDWARDIRDRIVARARPWLETSDDDLWNAMVGPDITRTWMVWSDGFCPQCKNDVKMYNWIIDIWSQPFKVRCPNCQTLFPTNDFSAYYRTGLNENGLFDPKRADRSLLFNSQHPDPGDPLHLFGVDDGEGYVENDHRWRFIGYYLVAGQWRQKIVGGCRALGEAYMATGDIRYARKAAILLDRVADLYPTFDFKTQGLVYEKAGHEGYVTVWHDACEEARELAQVYDQIFDGIADDAQLVTFLSQKAKAFHLSNPKNKFSGVQNNIEDGILLHTLTHRKRIESNYPRTPIALLTIETVLDWPNNRDRILQLLSEIVETSVKEDGMTGEKGLCGYSTIFPRSFAELMGRFDRLDSSLLDDLFKRYPDLHKTYRFHIDTWCLDRYYPHEGDCGSFASQSLSYCGAACSKPAQNAEPSMFYFLWRMFELTRDPVFVQVLYKENGQSIEGLPHDLCAESPERFQKQVDDVIREEGREIKVNDVHLEEWGLSILRSGAGDSRRAVWLDHDAGGRHSHRDGLNLGLFAYGIDLLPDFGYPPVGYGGWSAPKAVWYTRTAAHNTVVVDGKEQTGGKGKTALWGAGKQFDIVRVSAPQLIQGASYERTIAKVDLSGCNFYLIDLFTVRGGTEHAYFLSSTFGLVQTQGLNLNAATDYGYDTETKDFRSDPNPAPGWYADWTIDDRFHAAPAGSEIHLRYTGLTPDAEVALGKCWIDASGSFGGAAEWIPRLMIRRKAESTPLDSRFFGVLEPYDKQPLIESIQPLRLKTEEQNGMVVRLRDGRRQVFLQNLHNANAQDESIVVDDLQIRGNAETVFLSLLDNTAEFAAIGNGDSIQCGKWECKLKQPVSFIELQIDGINATALTGDSNNMDYVRMNP